MMASREAFAGAKQASLACDPGAYSGETTNVGILYSPTMDKTAVLPAKVISMYLNVNTNICTHI